MIDRSDVKKTAQLARLELGDSELEQYEKQLQNALNHFEAIQEVSTDGVEPMYSPALEEVELREDVVHKFDGRDEAMENAPELQGNLFRVPPVV